MPFVNEKENHQTIDHERGIVLTSDSGDRENNYHFELKIDNTIIHFGGQYERERNANGGLIVHWKIFKMDTHKRSKINDDIARELIVEAIETYGIRYMEKGIEQVTVTFSPKI